MPLHGKNILLRGCQLRNTEWCRGVVVYTGRETKIQMNAAEPAAKSSSLKPYVDRETLRVLCVQVGGASRCAARCWRHAMFVVTSRDNSSAASWRFSNSFWYTFAATVEMVRTKHRQH